MLKALPVELYRGIFASKDKFWELDARNLAVGRPPSETLELMQDMLDSLLVLVAWIGIQAPAQPA
jgi:hypothetical protein